MNFNGGMKLPRDFSSSNIQNRGFNNVNRFNSVSNNVSSVKQEKRMFRAIDGTMWSSFDEVLNHNKKYYYDQKNYKNNRL